MQETERAAEPRAPTAEPAAPPAEPGTPPAANPEPPTYDRWETEERLQHIGRILRPHARERGAPKPHRRRTARLDAAHAPSPAWHRHQKKRLPARRTSTGDSVMALAVWAGISLGVMFLACGGILLGWSVLGQRSELWTMGLPITLTGQVLLVIGLVLQLDRLWHHNRAAVAKLDDVDQQLHDLRSTTAMLGTTHSTPAVAFYSHLAGGASPQLLLADLKGQLDLLATRIEREK